MPFQVGIQRLSNASTLVWMPKLGAQVKGELMQNNISHLIISSMQIHLYILRHLTKMLRNIQLKTLCMPGCATRVCFNLSQFIICNKQIQHFRSTSVPKLSPGFGPAFPD